MLLPQRRSWNLISLVHGFHWLFVGCWLLGGWCLLVVDYRNICRKFEAPNRIVGKPHLIYISMLFPEFAHKNSFLKKVGQSNWMCNSFHNYTSFHMQTGKVLFRKNTHFHFEQDFSPFFDCMCWFEKISQVTYQTSSSMLWASDGSFWWSIHCFTGIGGTTGLIPAKSMLQTPFC